MRFIPKQTIITDAMFANKGLTYTNRKNNNFELQAKLKNTTIP